MRCIMCGTEMVLLRVITDSSNEAHEFERHTLHCPSCGDVEQILISNRDAASHDREHVEVHPALSVLSIKREEWAQKLARLAQYYRLY
jgi:hypothetical protein